MRNPRRGLVPSSVVSMAARIGVIGLSVVASGCATSQQQPTYVGGPYASQPHYGQANQVAPTRVSAPQPRKIEIEEDGKPSQQPPARRMRPEEDDPTQPWSPNYGKTADPGQLPAEPAARNPGPKAIEASLRNTAAVPARRLSNTEADSIIARAISAHEMRNQ